MILEGEPNAHAAGISMNRKNNKNNDKKIFRASEEASREALEEKQPAPSYEEAAPAVKEPEEKAEPQPAEGPAEETASFLENVDPVSAGMVEALITDGLRYRLKAAGRWLACMFLIMTAGLAAVAFLMRPVPVNTMEGSDPVINDIKTEDDYFGGEKKFSSQALQDAHAANSDVVGWLTLDGCEIDDRVMQSTDNNFYLRRNEEGRYSVWGCYFMDFINIHSGSTLYDRVTIIYGHSSGNSSNGNKFSKIKRYRDESFAKEHPVITLSLLYREMKWQVFACSDIPITINYIDPDPSEKAFKETISYLLSHSYVDFGVDVKDDDKILILSTCTSDELVRYVLAARLIND